MCGCANAGAGDEYVVWGNCKCHHFAYEGLRVRAWGVKLGDRVVVEGMFPWLMEGCVAGKEGTRREEGRGLVMTRKR